MWTEESISALFELPLFDLVNQAYTCHRHHFKTWDIELCALSSIKTGGCPEDCAYCPQSAHYHTSVQREPLLSVEAVMQQAHMAQKNGAKRFCIGAAWRSWPKKDFDSVLEMIRGVKSLGLETCATLGMLNEEQAHALKAAGLDYYNHNLDTSPSYYEKIIHTRTYQDRLNTIAQVVSAGISVCCGGIVGMGEERSDRIYFLLALLALPVPPQSIPINQLIPIPGTPLANSPPLDPFELIRMVAAARLLFPKARIRLAAGREHMSDAVQAWCFMSGANSIFIGEKLLTAQNPNLQHDVQLLNHLKINFKNELS